MKKAVSILLVIFLIIYQFSFFVPTVQAAASPWAQSDWSTGDYSAKDSNVVASTANQLTLSTTERLTNTGFETDLTSWSEVPSYTLNDQFTTSAPTTLVSGGLSAPTPTTGTDLWDAPAAAFTSGTYGWQVEGTNTIVNDSNSLKITYVDSVYGALDYLRDTKDLSSDLTVGSWYRLSVDAKVNAGSSVTWLINPQNITIATITNTDFQTFSNIFRATSTTGNYVQISSMGAGEIAWLDNLSLKPLTLSSLFSTVTEATANKVISAGVTLTAGTQAGLVINLDSASSPANFVIAYHDGTNVHLDKNVGGTYTSLLNVMATYSAGATLKVAKNGNVYHLIYNGSEITGSPVTISDAGIVNNTIHGLFSTYASNSFTNFLITTNLDGTSAEPTGGTRTVTDTNSKLSISGSQLSFATGGVTIGNPGIWYSSAARAVGKVLVTSLNQSSGNLYFGWDFSQSGIVNANAVYFHTGYVQLYDGESNAVLGTYSFSTPYTYAIVLRSTGSYHFIKGGTYTNWTLLYPSSITSNSPVYPGIVIDSSSVATADNIRIPTATWLPTPLAYDDFPNNGSSLGSTQTYGPDGVTQVTPSLAWTGSTWSVSSNKAVNTPTEGSTLWDAPAAAFTSGTYAWVADGTNTISNDANSLKIDYVNTNTGAHVYLEDSSDLSSNLTIGQWYQLQYDSKVNAGSNVWTRIIQTESYYSSPETGTSFTTHNLSFRAASTTGQRFEMYNMGTGESIWIDNLSLKPLTLSSLFSSVSTSDTDIIADANITLPAYGNPAGIVLILILLRLQLRV